MTRSEIELIDGENYGIVKKDRISSNQIKTRPASFNAISKVWKDFRLKFYTDKLNAEKKSALTQSYEADAENKLVDSAVEQISNKSLVIARLEEKIKILSKESVPTNYVDNRAIKLRTKMMNNLVSNCGNAYSIGIDKMDEVFGNSDISNNSLTTSSVNNIPNDIEKNISIGESSNDANEIATEDITGAIDEQQNSNVDVVPVVPVEIETNIDKKMTPGSEIDSSDEIEIAPSIENSEVKTGDSVDEPQLDVAPIENNEVIFDSTENGYNFDSSVSNDDVASAVMVDSNDLSENLSYAVDKTDEDATIDSYDAGDDALVFDSDEPALFELINPNEGVNSDETIVSDVKTDYENNLSDTPIIRDSYDDISVSRNGTTKAKVDRYKEYDNFKAKLKPFKVITFKDIFRPSTISYNDVIKPIVVSENSFNDDRYVPLIVPERNDVHENINVINDDIECKFDVSNVEDMKNKYLQLQKLLRSKTARLNSVKAEREAIKSEVENSSRDKEKVTASLNEKYQLMARYIGDLQRQCAIVDDETVSNENDINYSRQIIEDNRNVVDSTQRAIEELDDILRDSTSKYEDEDDYHIRRAA